jgi:hypothetical protein
MDRAQQLSQKVEKEVRYQLGDLQMQIIVLRSMMELSGGVPQPDDRPVPQPNPTRGPNDPSNPGPSPDVPPPSPSRTPVPDPATDTAARALNGHRELRQ